MQTGDDPLRFTEDEIAAYIPLAESIARSVEWSPEDHDDLVQVGLIALVEAMRDYQRRAAPVKEPVRMAAYVMRGWMKWFYRPQDRNCVYVPMESYHAVFDGREELYQHTYTQQYLAAVEQELGPKARAVAENLLSPSEGVGLHAIRDMEARARQVKEGKKRRGFRTCRVTHDHIRRALGLKETEWAHLLDQIRGFTRRFLQTNSPNQSPSGQGSSECPTAASTTPSSPAGSTS